MLKSLHISTPLLPIPSQLIWKYWLDWGMLLLYFVAKINMHWETDILAFTSKLKSTKPVFPAFLMDQGHEQHVHCKNQS